MSLIDWYRERSNCVFYAIGKFAREGGYVRFARSPLSGGLLRASWSKNGHNWFGYHAHGVKSWTRWQVMYKQFWFKGYEKEDK